MLDLRIDNWVYNEIIDMPDRVSEVTNGYIGTLHYQELTSCIHPIELTTDLLLKNDFRVNSRGIYNVVVNNHIFLLHYEDKKFFIVTEWGQPIYIKYVHELQNILCSFGHEELANNFIL